MALPQKGARSIVVDGVTYRWHVRGRPTYDQALGWSTLSFAAELAACPGATLVVRTPYAHPSNWVGLLATPIVPALVAAAIRSALAQGWHPEAPGAARVIDYVP